MTAAVIEQIPLLARAPGGAAGLRRLILDLAVAGRLVPQNPAEGSAEELIARAATARAAMGPTRKARGSVSKSEATTWDRLPSGWVQVRLGELTTKLGAGSTPLGGKQVYTPDGVMFLRSQNVWNEGLRLDDIARIPAAIHAEMAGTHVFAGDLLFNITGASIGRCAIVPSPFAGGNVSQHVVIARPALPELQAYLHKVLISDLVQDAVMAEQVGVSREGLSVAKLSEFKIPLPPLAEQHRIVAKVDELMALCDRLEARQQDAEAAHARLVQALLDNLTQARDADELQACWQRLAGQLGLVLTTDASIDAIKQSVLRLAFSGRLLGGAFATTEGGQTAMPDGWGEVQIEDIAAVGTGATPARTNPAYFDPPEFPWITSGETSATLINSTAQRVSARALAEANLTIYPPGTLIVAMYGQGKTRGQVSELAIEACTNQACAAIQLKDSSPVHRQYVKYFFEKSYDELRGLAAGGAQPNLNLGKIKSTLIPLPTLEEQRRIVEKVTELLALCDQLKARIAAARTKHAQLAEALVAQALSV
jgi:type I restriction enzyme, S subunit